MNKHEYGYGTHVGRVRSHNEDAFHADPEAGLWLVADGMGGHHGGEIASAILGERIPNEIQQGTSLKQAIMRAHQAIIDAAEHGKGAAGMGSTVVALRGLGDTYEIAWVGDSKAFLWNGALRQLTRDHSVVQRLLDAGAINAEEAKQHPQRNLLTQALGSSNELSEAQIDCVSGTFAPGDQILLCSDGLTSELDKTEIAAILSQELSAQVKVNRLIQAAVDAGGSDNITVLLVSAPKTTKPAHHKQPETDKSADSPKERDNRLQWLWPAALTAVCMLLLWWLIR